MSQKNVKGGYKIIEKDYSLTANDNGIHWVWWNRFTIATCRWFHNEQVGDECQELHSINFWHENDELANAWVLTVNLTHRIGYDPSKMPLGKIASKTL